MMKKLNPSLEESWGLQWEPEIVSLILSPSFEDFRLPQAFINIS